MKHVWIAIASYEVSEDGLRANEADPKNRPLILDHERLIGVDVGCWNCEEPYGAVKDKPCRASQSPLPDKQPMSVTSMGYTERLDRR